MFDCHNLLHPFQNDPGTSQRQRIIDSLLSDTINIDGRTLSDLLYYFYQLSGSIRYYDKTLAISDWRPFFKNSTPFLLTSISKLDHLGLSQKSGWYNSSFGKQPSSTGLQLMIYFTYYNGFCNFHKWYEALKNQDLAFGTTLETLIRNKLSGELKRFIALTNSASNWFGVKRPDFTRFLDTQESDTWGIQLTDLYSVNNSIDRTSHCKGLSQLYAAIYNIWKGLLDDLRSLGYPAEQDVANSLVPLSEELKEKHPPHLALIFAFIRLFNKLQLELNKKTKEHLKFFYTEVLQIKAREAGPDKANIIFEVQKILRDQYQKHRVAKATKLNGGRDKNNIDILFDTDDEIIVNETQIAEVRTLFLNNERVADTTFLEGAYIAPSADKADGIGKEFKDDAPKNWYTVGNKFSKYVAPGTKTAQRHPAARLGFLLASPVLYLKEGERTIDIQLECELTPSICNKIENDCGGGIDCPDYNDIYPSDTNLFYTRVQNFLSEGPAHLPINYILISKDLLDEAVASGMKQDIADAIQKKWLKSGKLNPCSQQEKFNDYELIKYDDWTLYLNDPANAAINAQVSELPDLFKSKYPLRIRYSGEKEWIEPSAITSLEITALNAANKFRLNISVKLNPDKPSVTFYNAENFGEDTGTELPALKLELEDLPGIRFEIEGNNSDECCLLRTPEVDHHYVSLYHFFRNVTVLSDSKIHVKVCGLRNFVVQNDESLMDVNNIIFPFGSRPQLGANFFINAPEVFCKNWEQFDLKFDWKDTPPNYKFEDYYHGYEDDLTNLTTADFTERNFVFQYSFLENGVWLPNGPGPLPNPIPIAPNPLPAPYHFLFEGDINPICTDNIRNMRYKFTRAPFGLGGYTRPSKKCFTASEFRNDSRNGFLKLTLLHRDFQHSRYSFVLTRQMLALGRFPDIYVGPVYDGNPLPGPLQTMSLSEFLAVVKDSFDITDNLTDNNPNNSRIDKILKAIRNAYNSGNPWDVANDTVANQRNAMGNPLPNGIAVSFNPPPPGKPAHPTNPGQFSNVSVDTLIDFLYKQILKPANDALDNMKKIRVVIPKEPYTPQFQNILIDYEATSTIDDIDLVHLYPYKGTYKQQEIELQPSLFPVFCDEGSLFIGLKDFQPGISLNMLFQFAEATADSEKPKERVHWHYLDNNVWRPLRTGFEVLDDGTQALTTSGIVKFALPENMSVVNTVMPSGLYWIKASIAKNSRVVSETIGIHTQAMSATFELNAGNDISRLDKPLEKSNIAKLLVADPLIKAVTQPYDSFGGSISELDGGYYLRVSEQLRHKGRAIQKWDYERIALQEFPFIYRAKCINHSFRTDASFYLNDIPYAPGYVILAVIPDLNILQAGQSFEPKVPLSLLEKIEDHIRKRTSPFVRLKVANPRYEKVNFCISVTLVRGKDEKFYQEQLKSDLRELLAPWAVGKYSKLNFGQNVYRSEIIRFLEGTEYVDFISELRMRHQDDTSPMSDIEKVSPASPRSILVAGDIEVKIIDETCPDWCPQLPESRKPCNDTRLIENYCNPITPIPNIPNNG